MNIDWQIILPYLIGAIIPTLFGAVAVKRARSFGKAVSKLGNIRLGKKVMDKLELELIKFMNEFECGLRADDIAAKVPTNIKKAYDEALGNIKLK